MVLKSPPAGEERVPRTEFLGGRQSQDILETHHTPYSLAHQYPVLIGGVAFSQVAPKLLVSQPEGTQVAEGPDRLYQE